jgi:hypothetical protein
LRTGEAQGRRDATDNQREQDGDRSCSTGLILSAAIFLLFILSR